MTSAHYSILSLNLGKPQTLEYDGKKIETGIMKRPADSAVMLYRENFEETDRRTSSIMAALIRLSVSIPRSTIRFGRSFSQDRSRTPRLVKILRCKA